MADYVLVHGGNMSTDTEARLHFKRIHSTRPIFSLRITKDYRAVGIQQDNQIIWFRIGSHGGYDYLLKQLKTS